MYSVFHSTFLRIPSHWIRCKLNSIIYKSYLETWLREGWGTRLIAIAQNDNFSKLYFRDCTVEVKLFWRCIKILVHREFRLTFPVLILSKTESNISWNGKNRAKSKVAFFQIVWCIFLITQKCAENYPEKDILKLLSV